MTWRDPFQVVRFCGGPICRAARIAIDKHGKLPVGVLCVATEDWWRPRWLEGVRKVWNGLERERQVFGRIAQETSDCLGYDTPLLRERSTFYKHFKIELLAREPFQRVLADRAELFLVYIAQ